MDKEIEDAIAAREEINQMTSRFKTELHEIYQNIDVSIPTSATYVFSVHLSCPTSAFEQQQQHKINPSAQPKPNQSSTKI